MKRKKFLKPPIGPIPNTVDYGATPEIQKEVESQFYSLVNTMIDGSNDGVRAAFRKRRSVYVEMEEV